MTWHKYSHYIALNFYYWKIITCAGDTLLLMFFFEYSITTHSKYGYSHPIIFYPPPIFPISPIPKLMVWVCFYDLFSLNRICVVIEVELSSGPLLRPLTAFLPRASCTATSVIIKGHKKLPVKLPVDFSMPCNQGMWGLLKQSFII